MAGLKKKKKEKSGSPNTVLVVFLVLFVLVSIGLGVWGYYGYAGQEELRAKRITAEAAEKAMKTTASYYEMLYHDLREAVGDKVDGDDLTFLTSNRDEFYKLGFSQFKNEKRNDAAKKLMESLHEDLGLAKEDKSYNKNFKDEYRLTKANLDDRTGQLAKQTAKNIRVENEIKKQNDKQDTFQQAANTAIQKGNQVALAEATKRSAEFVSLGKQLEDRKEMIEKLNKDIEALNEDHTVLLRKRDIKIKELIAELNEKKTDDVRNAQNAPRGDSQPLVLDVSIGKPLWDAAVGKIIRVEPDLRTVMINLGEAQGVKPELTFNIFAANASNRAIGQLKGTIEVIKVVDSSTSIARVTSLYDSQGMEIGLNDPIRSRVARETEAPLKDGDLLFNMFWGSRVAVSGYVGITGEGSDNPADQFRQTEDFMNLLMRQGMTIDAYVDLRDGQIKGKVTGKTRYLIRGDDLRADPKAAAKPAEGDDAKDPAADAPNAGRSDAVNKANLALRRDAMDKGVLVISAENFATMIGYRRVRSGNDQDKTSAFRPSLPYAGTNVGIVNPAPANAPMPDQKKAPEPKKDDGDN
jgi:hypothetical protein